MEKVSELATKGQELQSGEQELKAALQYFEELKRLDFQETGGSVGRAWERCRASPQSGFGACFQHTKPRGAPHLPLFAY